MTSFTSIEAAAHLGAHGHNRRTAPTIAQAEAGNYKKGRAEVHGMRLAIENPRGSTRRWRDAEGNEGETQMRFHYGYFEGVKGADGDELDCYIGPVPESRMAYVVNQYLRGVFDEHKVMLGFPDQRAAEAGYLSNYSAGWQGMQSCIPASIDQLKWWMANGDKSRPLSADRLPYDQRNDMEKVLWDSANQPKGLNLAKLLYNVRAHDAQEGLLFDSVSMADILAAADSLTVFDAMVVPFARLEPSMKVLQNVMNRAAGDLKVSAMQVSPPFKQAGTTNVATIYELSDGQTLTVYFHNPDTTPQKITPADDLISWKWMLNKKDVTIVVAPERGRDLNVRQVAGRVMALAAKNSSRFVAANAKRAERMQNIQTRKDALAEAEAELEALENEIAVVTEAGHAQYARLVRASSDLQDAYLRAKANDGTDPTTGRTADDLSAEVDAGAARIKIMAAVLNGEDVPVEPAPVVIPAPESAPAPVAPVGEPAAPVAAVAPQAEPVVEPSPAAASAAPDLTYRAVDDMFTAFYPNTPAGEEAWKVIAADSEGTGKVFTQHADGVIAQLREKGYTVGPDQAGPINTDDLAAQLLAPAAAPAPVVEPQASGEPVLEAAGFAHAADNIWNRSVANEAGEKLWVTIKVSGVGSGYGVTKGIVYPAETGPVEDLGQFETPEAAVATAQAAADAFVAPAAAPTPELREDVQGFPYAVVTTPTVFYRSVSPAELDSILDSGTVTGGGNRFNPWDGRREVFFSNKLNARTIHQGEEVSRRIDYAMLEHPLQQQYVDAQAAARQRRAEVATEYGEKVPYLVRQELARLDQAATDIQVQARDVMLEMTRKEQAANELREVTSAVLQTKPLTGARQYSSSWGNSGMGEDDEFGFDPGAVTLADIELIHLVKDKAVIRVVTPQELLAQQAAPDAGPVAPATPAEPAAATEPEQIPAEPADPLADARARLEGSDFNRYTKDFLRSLSVIKGVDEGTERGWDRSLFVNSITGKMKTVAKNDPLLAGILLAWLSVAQSKFAKPAITPRNAMWKLADNWQQYLPLFGVELEEPEESAAPEITNDLLLDALQQYGYVRGATGAVFKAYGQLTNDDPAMQATVKRVGGPLVGEPIRIQLVRSFNQVDPLTGRTVGGAPDETEYFDTVDAMLAEVQRLEAAEAASIAAAQATEPAAPVPDAPAAPTVPEYVANSVRRALDMLREVREAVDNAVQLEKNVGAPGRYQSETLQNRADDIASAQEKLAQFRTLATDKGIDAEAFIASLGGEPDLAPSAEARAWTERGTAEPEAPAQDDEKAAAVRLLRAVIDGTANMADPGLVGELQAMHAANKDDAEFADVFKQAVKAYSAYAVARANEAMTSAA